MPGYARPTNISTSQEVIVTPVGDIQATNLQSAIQELDTEKASIPIFTNEAARDAALPSPKLAQIVYISSTNLFQSYNGTAWVPVGASSSDATPILFMGA
jgi:hypothetical protein